MRGLLLIGLLLVGGCSTVQKWIPSFWDDNQAAYIIQARLDVERIDCAGSQVEQVTAVADDLRKFQLYSESKGMTQGDVLRVVEPMQATAAEWVKRGKGSTMYCQLKKQLLTQQGERAAQVILGRW